LLRNRKLRSILQNNGRRWSSSRIDDDWGRRWGSEPGRSARDGIGRWRGLAVNEYWYKMNIFLLPSSSCKCPK
jgi:hypothetical protein